MYTFDSRVRFSETDMNGRLTLTSLIDYLQDCSTFHSEDAGVGFSYTRPRHIAWFVNYWQIDILRLPLMGEKIRIGTRPVEARAFFGNRCYLIETLDKEPLVRAYAVWTLIDTSTQKPTGMDEAMRKAYPIEQKIDMEYLPRKIVIPKEGGVLKDPIRVNETMLDSNHHMNNSQYVRLACAFEDPEKTITRLRVQYKKQERLGAHLTPVLYERENGGLLVNIVDDAKEGCAVVELSYE